ncbi:GerMN domain-containing protein [Thermus thermamylovorans]|uniref:Spore gernimation protein n=1 Tax=Thermus thermamylovorans TaxID=2509362 RepID=A0A4Q9B901_9DEIN|nr:GerMN domain-containing protein [Thermus thermamylovorans]TBH21808.1 spore gernimation protein [Thermus thermamylovorans]
MRRILTFWNLLGLLTFLLGALVFWQTRGGQTPGALPLPPGEEASPDRLALTLYRPDPPRGFLRESLLLDLEPGETRESRALAAWAEALGAPVPRGLYRVGGRLVVDLPKDFVQGLDATQEAFRLYSLAYTLLATFPQGEEVRFLVEGEPRVGLAHLDLREPVRRP